MLKAYVFAVIALWAVSCTSISKKEGFVITGTVEGLEQGLVKVMDEDQNIIDSTSFNQGSFVVKGRVDQPRFVYIFVNDNKGDNYIFSKFLVENKDIKMQVDALERKATFLGAALHEEYMDYVRYLLSIPEQKIVQGLYNDLYVASANGEMEQRERVQQELSKMRNSVISILMRYKQDAGRSHAAAALVYDQTSIHGVDEKRFAISKFDSNFTDSYYLNKLRREVDAGGKQIDDSHHAENSLDYWGTYKGTIPAADCPGINVTLDIRKDKTFSLVYDYIDRDSRFESDGIFQVRGNFLITIGEKNDSTFYKIEENRLRILDGDRQVIKGEIGDRFILRKENTDVE
ncbi:MAG TPA: copper resistance protein NlpE N-terminal domain-containing protein [Candidatus Gallibacteroides avistercoris]|uniref:Copper resistance protein NlpE N-terminal domain-containing protein n=1 Tax=Candidatus Gallibacteroides avistercoris TaxID=2840833 RepID=A0A9D1M6F3_9BACT|nr:copper resistance protein NlpE N-terminal domain-containing protein [Candidatus Gallibacteroides avistercoris]